MKGNLAEGVLPGVLRELYVGRRTGLLHFSRGMDRHGVLFRRGHIVSARTDVKGKRLGETLLRLGWLSEADFGRGAALATERGVRMGRALVELGALGPDRLEEALALHAREILLSVLAWGDGSYAFEDMDPDSLVDEDVTLKVSTGELILEAVRHVEDPDVVRYALGNLDHLLTLSSDPLLRFQRITLSPMDGYLLSRIDGTLTAREVIKLAPVNEAEAQKGLFGLLSTGIVEYLNEANRKPRETRAPATPPPVRPAVATGVRTELPATERGSTPREVLADSRAGARTPIDDELRVRRRDILEAYEALQSRNHFEVMGVPRSASPAQIKDAYFALAKRFHPDVHHEAQLSDLQGKLEAVFIRLGEAYEVLKNPKSCAQYESRLEPLPQPEAPPAPAPEPPPNPVDHERIALENLRRAERHLGQSEYWDAIKLLESALPHLKGRPKQRARVDLARALAKNPHWTKDAEHMLEAVIEEDPKYVDAYFELGLLYRDNGLKSRALSQFSRVLELRPEHEDAQAALAKLTPEPAEAPPEGGGLLKKLFGRR